MDVWLDGYVCGGFEWVCGWMVMYVVRLDGYVGDVVGWLCVWWLVVTMMCLLDGWMVMCVW